MDKIKLKDGTTGPFGPGDKVIYVPRHLLLGDKDKITDIKNLGVVSSKNNKYVFVKFKGQETPQAVRPEDLYFLHARPDLQKLL